MGNHMGFEGSNREDQTRSNSSGIMSGSTIDRVGCLSSELGNEMAFDRSTDGESGPSGGHRLQLSSPDEDQSL